MDKESNENIADELKHLELLLRHIELVQQNCIQIAKKLIEVGDCDLGRHLIQNAMQHDGSKFIGIEWDCMKAYSVKKKLNKEESIDLGKAANTHARSNPHHPEYWGGIHNMPEVYIIEMVCDWRARSIEFAKDLREWIDNEASKRYKFNKTDKVYTTITKYLDVLLNKPFENLQPKE